MKLDSIKNTLEANSYQRGLSDMMHTLVTACINETDEYERPIMVSGYNSFEIRGIY